MGARSGKGYVTIDLESCSVTGCYMSPNTSHEAFVDQAEEMMMNVRQGEERIIVGDINAKSPRWGAPVWDRRGETWTEWLDAMDMVVINDGERPTWRRGEQTSFLDVTCATTGIAREISDWRVRDEESLSDHALISFIVKGGHRKTRPETHLETTRRNVIDNISLRANLTEGLASLGHQTPAVDNVVRIMRNAQDRATIRRRDGRPGLYPYWWSVEIERARTECTAARRKLTRTRGRRTDDSTSEETLREYRESRKALAKLIKASKRAHWEDIRRDLEDDIWGKGYQIATRDLRKKQSQ